MKERIKFMELYINVNPLKKCSFKIFDESLTNILSKINFAKNLQNNLHIFVFIYKNKNLNTLCFPRKAIRKTDVCLLSEMRFQAPEVIPSHA